MPTTFDTRRQRPAAAETAPRLGRRQARERLLHRATHLPEADRWLLEQVYGRGVPLSTLARAELQEICHKPRPDRRLRARRRRLARRVAGLVRRVRDPAFELVTARPELLPRPARHTAQRVLVQGQTLRDTAHATGLSLHQVRQHVRTVRELARVL